MIYGIVLSYGDKGAAEADLATFDTTAFWQISGFLRDLALVTDHYTPVTPPYSAGDTATGYLLLTEICVALFSAEDDAKDFLCMAHCAEALLEDQHPILLCRLFQMESFDL